MTPDFLVQTGLIDRPVAELMADFYRENQDRCQVAHEPFWANRIMGLEEVDAAFYYAGSGETIWPELPDAAGLAAAQEILQLARGLVDWQALSVGLEKATRDWRLAAGQHQRRQTLGRARVEDAFARGDSVGEELAELTAACDERPEIAAVELNVSCPNVATGLDIGAVPAELERVVARVRPAWAPRP